MPRYTLMASCAPTLSIIIMSSHRPALDYIQHRGSAGCCGRTHSDLHSTPHPRPQRQQQLAGDMERACEVPPHYSFTSSKLPFHSQSPIHADFLRANGGPRGRRSRSPCAPRRLSLRCMWCLPRLWPRAGCFALGQAMPMKRRATGWSYSGALVFMNEGSEGFGICFSYRIASKRVRCLADASGTCASLRLAPAASPFEPARKGLWRGLFCPFSPLRQSFERTAIVIYRAIYL